MLPAWMGNGRVYDIKMEATKMNVKKLMAVALLAPVLALCALALPARAQQTLTLPRPDPSVAEFARGVKFTVTGYTETEVLTNFPVLVRLSTAITGFTYSDFYADGSDLSLVDIGSSTPMGTASPTTSTRGTRRASRSCG